jgi:hypothetical protein
MSRSYTSSSLFASMVCSGAAFTHSYQWDLNDTYKHLGTLVYKKGPVTCNVYNYNTGHAPTINSQIISNKLLSE